MVFRLRGVETAILRTIAADDLFSRGWAEERTDMALHAFPLRRDSEVSGLGLTVDGIELRIYLRTYKGCVFGAGGYLDDFRFV